MHDSTPPALAAACERYGLPLIEVPPSTPFTAVARAVWQVMAETRHRQVRRVAEAQQHLAAAAARPHPVPAVLRQLARHLDARVALLDEDGRQLHAAGPDASAEVRTAMQVLAQVVRPGRPGTPASAANTAPDGTRLAAYPLASGAQRGTAAPTLVVAGVAGEPRDPADHAITGVAAVLLSLLIGPYGGSGATCRTSALVRLLLGAAPAEVAALLAARAGEAGQGEQRWTVVHGRSRQPGAAADASAIPALAAALGTPLVDLADGILRALLPAERTPAALPGWTLGISAPAPVGDLPAADAQAAGALRRAIAARTTLARHPAARNGIAQLLDPTEATGYARDRLAPIADRPALVATLRTWLSMLGNWDRTAVASEVHRNTVRQRIARAATLLEVDFDDPDVRADLWLALRYIG